MKTSAEWKPLLVGDEAQRALSICQGIADRVHAAVGDGHLDPFTILLDAYLATALSSEAHATRALTSLEECTGRALSMRSPALFGGFLGVGFTIEHVYAHLEEWMEPDATDACGELDAVVRAAVARRGTYLDYGLIGGLAGVATYAIERLPREPAREILGIVIDRLAAGAERTSVGITWHTPPGRVPEAQRSQAPLGYYNLGVAHGVPGLLVVLATACINNVRPDTALDLLEGVCSWIVAQQGDDGEGARFPSWMAPERAIDRDSREAWCDGGLGLSVALLHAARLVGNEEWEARACEYARLEAGRSTASSGVRDVSLCHGASGNAHLYNRLYQATGDELFLGGARRWLSYTLAEHESHLPSTDVLVGIAGVGLVLLAASTSQEPRWDRLLAADIPLARP